MTNQHKKIWIPKKQRLFFNEDTNFNIADYVLNKDIQNIPKKWYLIDKAMQIRHIGLSLLIIFILFALPLIIFSILYIVAKTQSFCSTQLRIVYEFGISAAVLWVLGWIIDIIDILCIAFWYSSRFIKPTLSYFNKLVQENKLIPDLNKYPVVFIMAFYYKKKAQFSIDYPNTYQIYSPVLALIGLGIFFDRLHDYINQKNN